jgi:peptidoglycan/LPS O-acetylase OafA/YrhL
MVFDILRALAATLVVISHIRNLAIVDYAGHPSFALKLLYTVTGFGHQAVILFFVISGYWIAGGVIKRVARGSWTWSGYALQRLTRLWVVLIPALLLGLAFDWTGTQLFQLPVYSDGIHGNTVLPAIASHLGADTFITNVLFLQTLLGPRFGSNGPLWSLANEFWYYVWFAALYLPFAKPARLRNWAGVPIAAITMYNFTALLPGFACWLLGAGLFALSQKIRPRHTPMTITVWALSLAALGASLLVTRRWPTLDDPGDFLVAATTMLFLYATLRADIRPFSVWKPLARYGASSSYSLYVIHYPVVILIIGLLCRHQRLAATLGAMGLVAVVAIAVIALGYLFSRVTERKTDALRNAIENRLVAWGTLKRAE